MEALSNSTGIVHFVHGTFAAKADWVHPDSVLATRVGKSLGNGIRIEPFGWSGCNSHAARLLAGKGLAEKMLDFERRSPQIPQYVIAHSHGGNVAAYAVEKCAKKANIRSVVSLGTPYIHARARDLAGARRLLSWILIAIISIILTAIIAGIIGAMELGFDGDLLAHLPDPGPDVPRALLESPYFALVVAGMQVVIVSVLGWLFCRPFLRLRQYLDDEGIPGLTARQARVTEQLSARFGEIPALVVDTRRDEAAWWLSLISRVALLPYRIWRPSRFMAYGLVVISALLCLSLWVSTAESAAVSRYSLLWLFAFLEAFVVLATVTAFLGWLACLIWPAIFRSHALGFGRDDFMLNFIVAIDSSPIPGGSTRIEHETVAATGKGLHHSRFYQDENVMQIICGWLQEIAASDRRAEGRQ